MNFHEKLAGLVLILAAIAFLFAPFSANAEMKIISTGIMKYVVVEKTDDGHITYSYHTNAAGKVFLMDVKRMYDGKLMSPKQYEKAKDEEFLEMLRRERKKK